MHRRFVLLLGTVIALALMNFARAESDNSGWDDNDTATENRGDKLFDAGQFGDAEIVYREVLDRRPESASALMYHIKALNALGHYNEAVQEGRKAVALAPNSGPAYGWLGHALVLSHHYDEAVDAFLKSLMRDPKTSTMIWLSGTYYLQGKISDANKLLDVQVTTGDDKCRAENASLIADFFRQTGHGDLAIAWWRKSYALGNTDAARYLAWAYDGPTPVFPYDAGEVDYWQRRSPDDPYRWFPRLASADQFVAWAHGWGVVLLLLGTALILPWISVGIVAYFPARRLSHDPTVPWMEQARRAYPFLILLSISVIALPALDWCNAFTTPGSVLPIPKWIVLCAVITAGFWASNSVVVFWARRYRTDAGTAWQNMKNIAVSMFLRGTALIIFIVVGVSLPDQFGWRAALTITAAVAAYFYLQFGGWVRLAGLLHVIVPADPELVHDAADLALSHRLPPPSVWTLRWRKANAFALPFSNAILVTQKLRETLTREELKSVLAHELAHLCEDRGTRLLRLFTPLLLLPIFTMNLWSMSYFWLILGGFYLPFLVGIIFMRKRARRMEERADTFGKAAESDTGLYPLALAKLYEANLIPAVMPGKGKVHPHLYDRLLTAGITPDYPRPKPPGRWGVAASLLVVAIHGACLWALWLCLF